MDYREIILGMHEELNNKELFVKNIGNSKGLSEAIDKYLIPQELEKKTNAEISTPYKLRQEMLDKIPSDFWTTPKRVFEPCSGKGGFVIDIVHRFVEGMKESILDEKERYKTIVEECIYFSDINPTNIFICKLLLDPYSEYDLKYNEGDTLGLDVGERWDIEGFDAVIGNPPYNSSGNTGTGNTIWQHFVKKTLVEWINDGGYLLFVHPPGWRKPNTSNGRFNGLFNLMTKENHMIHLDIHDSKDGLKQFNCGTRYDWYLIERRENTSRLKTYIRDQEDVMYEIDLHRYKWLANSELYLIDKLLAHEDEERCQIIYNRNNYGADKKWVSKERTEEFCHPLIHSTPKNGARYMYSKFDDKGHFKVSKVIFGDSGINDPIIDTEGIYGMTQHAMGILIKNEEEGEKIRKVLCSSIFGKILNACLWSSFAIEWSMFRDFKSKFYELLSDK